MIEDVDLLDFTIDEIEIEGFAIKVLRLDLIDPFTGGNKWFKLKWNLEEARERGLKTIVSFGGPYSNHIAALAEAGKKEGLQTVGIIRGKIHDNPTLNRAAENGMQLFPCDFEKYRLYRDEKNWMELNAQFPDALIIPEGGSNLNGLKGCKEIAALIPDDIDHVFLPVGTGTTMAGIYCSGKLKFQTHGIEVVKAKEYLESEIQKLISIDQDFQNKYIMHHKYTFGGYAKADKQLTEFTENFNAIQPFRIEPIYTGRMFYGINDLILKGFFKKYEKIMAIHTGGMQYLRS